MGEIVLRVRLTSGDHLDVKYDDPDGVDEDEIVQHVVATLAQDSGALITRHGDRPFILFGRGVVAIEVAPLGAVL